MNIYFSQVERRSQLFSYLLAAFAICTLLMLSLSFSRFFEQHWSGPSTSAQVVPAESINIPVPVPAPLPPEEQVQMSNISLPAGGANIVPQVVPIPVPSVP